MHNFPLAQALHEILAPRGLEYKVKQSSLWITASAPPPPIPPPSPDPRPTPVPTLEDRVDNYLADWAKRGGDRATTSVDFQNIVISGTVLINQAVAASESSLARKIAPIILLAARKSGDAELTDKTTLLLIELKLNKP
jgi:hypothetical protein